MYLYFLFIRIAAWLGHPKARALVRGQKELKKNSQWLKANTGAIWIHAASVGEFEQARPLIERLRAMGYGLQGSKKTPIVITFFSPSGYEARKEYPLADGVYYLPFATRRNARRFLDALQPSIAIFVKYEFWPAYLRALRKRAIPTYSISAIFRPTQRFFHWYGKASLRLLHCFTHIFVQDEASRRLLAEHGVHEASVAGDTRFDRVKAVMDSGVQVAEDKLASFAAFSEGCDRVIVAGSTWPEDEKLLAKYPSAKLILVPHEIDEEHLHFIFNLFQGRLVRYSSVTNPYLLQQAQVLLVDTIGLLSSVYRFGQVAYIGGGFGVGIHNTIEAAVYGLPVIFGPNYTHFREAKGLIAAGAARSIANYCELEAALTTALERHEEIGAKAAAYVQSELGATEKICREIFNQNKD